MNHCENCMFWKLTLYDYGKCEKIKEKIDIDITYGWDGGYINFIETEKDFCCNLFQNKYNL